MKKLGKKISFLTKVMLVVGLLISNLSSLSVVFADELTIDVSVVDGKLNIKYLGELTDEVKKVRIDVYENYIFLDGSNLENEVSKEVSFVELNTFDEEVVIDEVVGDTDVIENENLDVETEELIEGENELDVVEEDVETDVEVNEDTDENDLIVVNENEEEILTDETEVNIEEESENTEEVSKEIDLVIEESILASNIFDGRYDVEIEIIDITDEDNEKVIATREYGMDVLHESGIEYHLFDAVSNEELLLDDGRYSVSHTSPKVRVEGRLLTGGLSPKDMLMYNDVDYYAEDFVKEVFTTEIDFGGRLYGDYTFPVAVEIEKYNRDTDEYELIEFPEEELIINVLYGTYDLNTLAMNFATDELVLNEMYEFVGDTKNGVVYVLLDENKTNTMLDLYNIANYMFDGDEIVTFDLSNNEYENVISSYDESTATLSLVDMLANIDLDENTLLSLINEGLTITYKIVFAGDVNGDNVLSQEDLVEIIDQVLGNKDADLEKSDFYDKNGEVNTLDTIYFDQVIKTGDFNTIITEEDVQIESELNVLEEEIINGGKFTVELMVKLSDYSINGLAGLFTYDDTKLQLESIESVNEWTGNNNEGQFLYVGEESLELPVVEDENENNDITLEDEALTEENINQEIEEIVVTEDYVVVKAIFTALKSGVHTVGVENLEYFNQNVYYGVSEDEIFVEVTVSASDNNNLSSLTVAGQIIELIEGQLEYEIIVGNDVLVADVEAILENVSANITSIVSPEELVEGENIITITVIAENGDEKVYTVKVIREASQKEETNVQTNYNNYNDYNDNNDDEEDNDVVVTPNEEDEEEEDNKKKQEESDLSRIVIIILILLVIAGLIYLIFKDEDDEETVRVNKDINKLKKEVKEPEVKKEVKAEIKVEKKTNNGANKNNNNNKNSNNRNKKKDR